MSHANQGRTLRGRPPSARQLELLRAIVAAPAPAMATSTAGKLVGMGPNQAREALHSLEARGLVVLASHGGPARVTDDGLRVATGAAA